MTHLSTEAALELLKFHACSHGDTDHPKWKTGFLGSLRPYAGLDARNFHEVMSCLKAIEPRFEQPTIDSGLMADIWAICHLGRAWGVEPDGMLRRNNLISREDVARLESWIFQISYTVFCLLAGCGDDAFEEYERFGRNQ